MKIIEQALRPTRMALVVAAAGLLPLAGHAQGVSMSEMQSRYEADIARCATLTDPESQRTCRREAGAAIHEARNNRLVTRHADTAANAAARCARLPTAQRSDCERLMSDSSAVEHGSVSGGGVLRELSITVPVDNTATHSYGAQPAPTYGSQTAPTYGTQPAPGYTQPAPAPSSSGGYHHPTPAPAQGGYGAMPAQ